MLGRWEAASFDWKLADIYSRDLYSKSRGRPGTGTATGTRVKTGTGTWFEKGDMGRDWAGRKGGRGGGNVERRGELMLPVGDPSHTCGVG